MGAGGGAKNVVPGHYWAPTAVSISRTLAHQREWYARVQGARFRVFAGQLIQSINQSMWKEILYNLEHESFVIISHKILRILLMFISICCIYKYE
jgi:hypothetical protein